MMAGPKGVRQLPPRRPPGPWSGLAVSRGSRQARRRPRDSELGLLRQTYPDVPVILLLLPFVPRVQTGTVITDDPDYQRLLATIRSTIRGYSGCQVLDPLSAFQSLAERRMLPRGFANSRPGTGHLNTMAIVWLVIFSPTP